VGEVTPAAPVDVVVLGTGAAGLVAALAAADSGASVTIVEKAPHIGGTTALSGGVMWLPANPVARAAGVVDAREDALDYLSSLSNGMIRPELAAAFVDGVDPVVDWLQRSTPIRLQLVEGYPDYHPEHPGGKAGGGRSCEPTLFPLARLGDWQARIAGPPRRALNRESPLGGGTGVLDPDVLAERVNKTLEGGGRALVAALLKGCLDRGIEPLTDARATRLLLEDGAVRGVEVEHRAQSLRLRADAVVIATGGFEFDPELARAFLRGPMSLPPGAPTNTGDGLRMAMRVGAALGNMREAWWVPVVELPGSREDGGHNVYLLLRERTLPRSIMVNAAGRRFTNEAVNYNALGSALHEVDPVAFSYGNQPCWLLFDHEFVQRYGGFGSLPGDIPSWIPRSPTLHGLAELIGVSSVQLAATVDRWNHMVDAGQDEDFGRGESAYDWWCGDRAVPAGRTATLGRVDRGPFYAVEVISSCLGTKGGPRTTVDAAVIDVDERVVPGLFAVGNAMAGPTGMVYGGAGGTLGPAVVFGHRAGRAAARSAVNNRRVKELHHATV
jgi:3-oxosteroid 1-dehydrogenase